MADPIVEPLAAAPPAVEPTTPIAEAPAPAKGKSGLPDELLQIPAVQAIMAGSPAAFSASLEEFKQRPEAKALLQHKDDLMKSGFGLYRSLDGQQGVIFNQLHLHGDEIKQADTEGRLQEVAPPFDVVNEAVGKSGANNPVLSAASPAAFASAPVPPPVGIAPTQPASVQKTVAGARAKNLSPGAPTSGAKPGAGRLLNSILKPVL